MLSERGLRTAVESQALRAPVPVELGPLPAERLPEAIELAAYFVISEALTNVAKYADATQATVSVERYNGRVVVAVADDAPAAPRGPRQGQRPARPRRPHGGARGSSRCGIGAGKRNDSESQHPMRVVVADDSVLLREGVVRLLEESGFEVVAQAERRRGPDPQGRRAQARCRGRRHPRTASTPTMACAPPRDPRDPPGDRRAVLAVRRGGLRAGADRRQLRRRRLSAEGPRRGRPDRLRRVGQARGEAARRSTRRWSLS